MDIKNLTLLLLFVILGCIVWNSWTNGYYRKTEFIEYNHLEDSTAKRYPRKSVVTKDNLNAIRLRLTSEVFGTDRIPSDSTEAISNKSYHGYKYVVLETGARYFDNGSNKLLIFHAGHKQDALCNDVGGGLIRKALSNRYDVLALNMPTGNHERFSSYKYPLAQFMKPIALSLNYVTFAKDYKSIVMSGLSGGGWSTVLYSAMDTRIDRSYPVAGSWPKYLRYESTNKNSIGDYEQTLPGLSVGYLDLYALATDNRIQYQIFNDKDSCCFAGYKPLNYKSVVDNVSKQVKGVFDIIVVSNNKHSVHESVYGLILG